MNCFALLATQRTRRTFTVQGGVGDTRDGKQHSLGEQADEVLLLAVLHVQHHVLEVLREARPHGERLLRVTDADDVRYTQFLIYIPIY